MPSRVWLTDDAARDLNELFDYIAANHGAAEAGYVFGRVEEKLSGLSDPPKRGTYPKELPALGIQEYREVFFKPHRIVYRIATEDVFVLLIADGRRDLRGLLQRRLLKA